MSVADTTAADSVAARRDRLRAPHVHTWELRAEEFDTWGRVSLYECLGCPAVRYV
jgi:hypothetical protein